MNKIENIDILNYMINKQATAKETAEYFNVSLSTIRKRLVAIKSDIQDENIKKELLEVIANNQDNGRVKGGLSNNSGVKISESMEDIVRNAITILANNLTLEMASLSFQIPTSTLSEHLKLLNCKEYNDIYIDLLSLFEYHRTGKSSNVDILKMQSKYTNMLDNLKKANYFL